MALIKMPNLTNLAVIAINGAYNLDLKFNTYFVLCINNDECDNDKAAHPWCDGYSTSINAYGV